MPGFTMIRQAAGPTLEVVRHVKPDQLDGPTPCTAWDVRKLINHLLFWAPILKAAARKEPPTVSAVDERDRSPVEVNWSEALEVQLGRLVDAWSRPDAWEGTTAVGDPTPLPAPVIGGMVLGELVVHGWDLARATGQQVGWDERVLEFSLERLSQTAEQGRDMGVYGPAVPVPGNAPVLDRILGLAGRDPRWTPASSCSTATS
nr:hypothetical protein asmbl_26 [uncultured bacterium]